MIVKLSLQLSPVRKKFYINIHTFYFKEEEPDVQLSKRDMIIAKVMKENLQLKEKLNMSLVDKGVQCDYWTNNGKILLYTYI